MSNLNGEEKKAWSNWYRDPMGGIPHRDIGSRSRPVSMGAPPDDIDELYERMVRRGIVASEPKQ